MAENKQIARNYEGMFLFGTAATANVDAALATVRGFIEKHGGSVHVLKKWDDRKLAYEVEKQQRGLYVLAFFNAPTSAVAQIEREVRLSDEVLRVLILDGSHLSVEEVEAMTPERPEPREPRGEGEFREGRTPRREPEESENVEDGELAEA